MNSDPSISEFQAHLFSVRKLAGNTVSQRTAALRFLFVKTLKRTYMLDHIPFPKVPLRLPTVLSPEEVTWLIDAAPNLFYRTILMTLYSTGARRAELVQLKATDIDKELMLVHIRQGKGKRDRSVPLSAKLLEALREYWRWMRPRTISSPAWWTASASTLPPPIKWSGTLVAWPRNALASTNPSIPTRSATVLPPTCWRPAPIFPTIQRLLGHADIRDTTIYLHLSRKHLRVVANPLDEIAVSSATTVRGKVKRAKR
jgi:integrase/recombinase XerD